MRVRVALVSVEISSTIDHLHKLVHLGFCSLAALTRRLAAAANSLPTSGTTSLAVGDDLRIRRR